MRRVRRDEGGRASRQGELGQGLVELALCLPLLLMLLLGIVEVGRIYYYTTIIASAAREGAGYASRHASDPDVDAEVEKRACYETGLVAYNSSPPCPAGVTAVIKPTALMSEEEKLSGDKIVVVTYEFKMLFEFKLFAEDFRNILPSTLQLQAEARLPNLTN